MKVVWQTHIAGGAVEVIFATANPGFKINFDQTFIQIWRKMWKNNSPADSTSCAVKLLLVFVVIELAVKAEVLRVQNEELFNFIVLENKQNKQKLPSENRIKKT